LLARGANANVQDAHGNTPLMSANMFKHTRCAELLLPHSDLSLTNKQGTNAFHDCVQTASEECFKLLLPRVAIIAIIGHYCVHERPEQDGEGAAEARRIAHGA
jgi:ankyrin repeat protein